MTVFFLAFQPQMFDYGYYCYYLNSKVIMDNVVAALMIVMMVIVVVVVLIFYIGNGSQQYCYWKMKQQKTFCFDYYSSSLTFAAVASTVIGNNQIEFAYNIIHSVQPNHSIIKSRSKYMYTHTHIQTKKKPKFFFLPFLPLVMVMISLKT